MFCEGGKLAQVDVNVNVFLVSPSSVSIVVVLLR